MLKTLSFVITTALLTGCYGRATVGATYSAPEPELVYVSPGVSVIADYDYPVFYADNVYWRYDGGVWYRSRSYTGGWTLTTHVPVAVRTIDRPTAYVRYRGSARVTGRGHYAPPPGQQARDHRDHRGHGRHN